MYALFLVVFSNLLGFGIIIPLLPYYAEHFGANPNEVTLLMASYSLMQLIFSPILGRISDIYGRKKILVLCLIGSAISYFLLYFATNFALVLFARSVAGLFGSTTAIANAYVTETTSSANRSKGMGLIGAAFGLGLVFGPVIGGYFGGGDINNIDYKTPFFFASLVAIISCILAYFILIEPKKRNKQFISINFLDSFKDLIDLFKIPALLFLIILSFLITFSFAGFETTFALWTERAMNWASRQTGYAFTFTALLVAIIQGVFIGKLTKKFGELKLLITSCFLMLVGLFFITLSAQNLFYLTIALGILGISVGLGNPSLNSLLSKNLSKGIIGASFGVVQSVGSLARILSPLAMGNLFYFFGKNSPYNFGAFLMFISLLIFFYYFFILKKSIKT
ncbi:MAG: MFS transporter [Alphaproteobacteria bacterium]|nr:MFS transporter [Alphaproteobacteria bacterium]|tara:strand:- start:498 stop:1679 length:1182 start_codon:yes stop_codon:yes gene_type:complete